jgi:hypothetical protein
VVLVAAVAAIGTAKMATKANKRAIANIFFIIVLSFLNIALLGYL